MTTKNKLVAKVKAKARRPNFSRDKILVVATKMFAERGFAAISIRDIANTCGISIPSIYHFFGDKESLYQASYEQIFGAAAMQLRGALIPGVTAKERIKQFTVALCDVLKNNHDFRRLLQRELLREERRAIDQLTTHHFRREFVDLNHDISTLSGAETAVDRAFSIYALVFGLIQLGRIGELAGMNKLLLSSPAHLAEHVLAIVLPEQF